MATEETDEILDATGRTVFTGKEPHPYRTNTRFAQVNGQWEPILTKKPAATTLITRSPEEQVRERNANRAAAQARANGERRRMAKLISKIAKRQSKGDPATVQSRAEDFPLLETLRRDKNEEGIKLVRRYRLLVALCEAEPLKGLDYSRADGGEVVRVSKRLTPEADVDKAGASGWSVIADGEIRYSSKIRKSKGAHAEPSKRVVVASNDNAAEGSRIRSENLHIKVTDEVLVAQIDAKPILAELRRSIGPLVDPFEDAVLGGKTYEEVGLISGASARYAVGVGKSLVGTAIASLTVTWKEIDARERLLEIEAARRLASRNAANDNRAVRKAS
ncbi:hypothetical protein ABID08_002082 [Rhizobium binae]|uniref:Uncharacterized protein n=1 Tax=Rhizobium binae TaxID=1138190 RepID=A0ABV2ME56_9HYPH|nr:hypothetical protein [Rhizobium binae]MBX4992909.1 hypothetical protein [Rhizobium binae]NKL47214.1 hypothetical protein [Rhizobium leguminosarum bv. viciae]QSY84151.1 hypothetical protein J2J99_10370 [Rhizobium binae]